MSSIFHLSIGVLSIEDSLEFFTKMLNAKVTHRDSSGYVNIDVYGNQLTLKPNPSIVPDLADFHFGINLSLSEFDELANNIIKNGHRFVFREPEIWDMNTPMERKKIYLKCPTGYLIEIKGYK